MLGALKSFENALDVQPDATEPHVQLGRLYTQLKEYEEAINPFSIVIDAGEETAQVYNMRGCARYAWLQEIRKYGMARYIRERGMFYPLRGLLLDDFAQAIRIDPAYGPPCLNRAWEHQYLNHHVLAVADLRKAHS